MFSNRFFKEIKGTVFLDNNNKNIDNSKQFMENVEIRLFAVDRMGTNRESEKDVNILRQKRILTAKTNARGEFRFFVNEGDYALSLDIDTIPVGKGVVEANRFLKAGERNIIDFTVKNIYSIDVENSLLKISDGEHFSINPIFKDKDGNILSAKANILPENKDIEIGPQTLRVLSEFSDEFETN
ncbi:MAG: hypothetical protein Q8942_11960, partial [Bacillota bacterium]|nr:hypothetical protein [Bacillota bacterium]